MDKYRLITATFGLVFSLTLGASAVRADAVHVDRFIDELSASQFSISVEQPNLDLSVITRAEESKFVFAVAEASARSFPGFNVPTLDCASGIIKTSESIASPNPEPATMILLGSGLLGGAAIIRRRRRT